MEMRIHFWKAATIGLIVIGVIAAPKLVRRQWLSNGDVATLAAGSLAFLAVMIQLEAERNARLAEAERQNRAVATALAYEIDYVYRYFIRDVGEFLKATDRSEPLLAKGYETPPFAVYYGNTAVLGRLQEKLVGQIVHFYAMATNHVATIRAYSEAVRNSLGQPQASEAIDWEDMAQQYRQHTEGPLPGLRLVAYDVSAGLCNIGGIEFKSPDIAVAAEDRSALVKEVLAMERNTR
jgi:hypothetical protein